MRLFQVNILLRYNYCVYILILSLTRLKIILQITAAPTDPEPESGGLWGSHAALVQSAKQAVRSDDIPGRARTELRGFLGRNPVDITANPLEVWERLRPDFPHLYLYTVARRFLTVVATSLPSERAFSKAGIIMDDKSSRLTGEHVAMRMFLSSVELELWEKCKNSLADFSPIVI